MGNASPCGSVRVEALALLQRGDLFDLALLDMHMPAMDGLMLAHEIRRNQRPCATRDAVVWLQPARADEFSRTGSVCGLPVQAGKTFATV